MILLDVAAKAAKVGGRKATVGRRDMFTHMFGEDATICERFNRATWETMTEADKAKMDHLAANIAIYHKFFHVVVSTGIK